MVLQIEIAWVTTDNEGKFKQGLALSLQNFYIPEALHNLLLSVKKTLKRVKEYLCEVLEIIDYNTIL